jgi:predicted CopG family antitoxin
MKRTLIQFDEDMYDKLRQRAFDKKQSISSVVREFVEKGLQQTKRRQFNRSADFQSVAAGSSQQGRLAPVSERHDEALAEIYERKRK